MSTVDTSSWNPDADLNTAIEGIPLNADAGIAQTWQALRILMAAVKGDGDAIKLTINQPDGTTIVATNQTLSVVDNAHAHNIANVAGLQTALNGKASNASMTGATASADGASGLVPKPEAGDQDKVLKGDGTWGALSSSDIPSLDASKIASGTIDIARLPAGALERLVTVADQTARFALTTASVQLGDTVKQLDTGVMYIVVDTSKLGQADGYVEFTAGSATSVPWSGVTGKPSTFPPSSHAHGNLTNDGKIGSTANLPLITTTSGKVTTGSFGSAANTFCQGNDSRLSDSRTPKSHTHGNITNAGAIGSTSGLPVVTGENGVLQAGSFGTTTGTVCEGNDSRLSNARTPTSHTHGSITNDGKLGTASRVVVTDGSKAVGVSSITTTKLGYLADVTANIQAQIDGKADKATTLSGYGITDAKIANGTITIGSSTITPLTSGSTLDATKLSGTASIATTGNAGTATKLATSRTISLTGDVSGSASFDGSANASITATVADGSHNHVISNVDGLQTAMDAKATDSAVVHLANAETISGAKTFTGDIIGINKTSSTDNANNLYSTTAGSKLTYYTTTNGGTTLVNVPAAVNTILESRTIRRLSGSDWIVEQICHNSNGLYYRKGSNGTWSGWKTFAFTDSSITGNAGTATKFASAQSVALTGDVTGSASSQAGWSIATTLADSGVTAGRYTSVSVDAKGRVTAGNVKHSYTVAKSAATGWYRIANANTSQTDTTKPIHAQFILTAYNTSYAADYYERWFVNAIVFGRAANIVVFGGTTVPFSQARILYENTVANIDANDRPALDIYLNNVLPNGTTKIEIEEVYNNGGWTFVADGQLAASTVPSGFENVGCGVRNNGVERSTYADYVSYLNRQISNFTAAFTLADSYLYRSRTLNCTGTFTITIPSINSGYMWCVIKNKNTSSGVITLHPSTTSVLIDGSNADITLQPMEYVCIHSAGANNYSLIADGRWKTQCIHLPTNISNPERTVLCADGVWRDISQIAFPL